MLSPALLWSTHPYLFVLSATLLVYVASLLVHKMKPLKAPPMESGLIPFVGCGLQFAKMPLDFAHKMYKRHGDVFTLKMAGKRLTFLVGPEAHAPFFRGSDDDLDQNEPYSFAVPIFGKGVVYDVPTTVRIQQLKFISKSLGSQQLKTYVSQIVQETEAFFDSWGNEGEVDIRDAFSQLIILTASRTLMGREIREHLFKEVSHLYQQLDEGLTPLSIFWPNAPIKAHRIRDHAREEMVKLFGNVIKQRRLQPEVKHDDVLQVFMDAAYKDGRPLTEQEISGLMIALLFAGQHTSSITASWTGLLLLTHKEKFLGPVLKEQEEVLAANGGELNMDALNKMTHLHRCMKEALPLKNYVIPKNDYIFVSPALSHRLPEVFTNPDEFDPDRFASERAEDKKAAFSYLGFGGGAHACMGENFAYLQVKTIWSTLLRHFDMDVIGELPKPDYKALVVGPTQPAKIHYKRRVAK